MNNKIFKIYKIVNIKNNKIYIGKTSKRLKERWSLHVNNSKNKKFYFSKAIKKYGKENFILEIIQFCNDEKTANELEKYYIKFYNSHNPKVGYNSTLGGEGVIPTDETRKKMSISGKNKKITRFRHDCDWHKNNSITKMMSKWGHGGYGIYLLIIEFLCEQTGFKIKLTKTEYEKMSKECFCSVLKIKEFINDCVIKYHLFKIDDNYLTTYNPIRRISYNRI